MKLGSHFDFLTIWWSTSIFAYYQGSLGHYGCNILIQDNSIKVPPEVEASQATAQSVKQNALWGSTSANIAGLRRDVCMPEHGTAGTNA